MADKEVYILENKDFPDKLQKIKNSPERLYLLGNKKLIFEDSLAVIGTRKISDYGIMCLEKIVSELVLRDIIITSGLAKGTDALAHKMALDFQTKTIAVLGGGFDYVYPKENEELFKRILRNDGLIISEYPPDEKYKSEYFPKRNRIISAISLGVLVIEATYRSGTSITANYAREQGKKVFAVPGRIDSKYSYGAHEILKAGGRLVTEGRDIINSFPQFMCKKRKSVPGKELKNENKNQRYEKIIKILENGSTSIDDIVYKSNLERTEILNILFEMQLEGIIEERIGDGYVLKK